MIRLVVPLLLAAPLFAAAPLAFAQGAASSSLLDPSFAAPARPQMSKPQTSKPQAATSPHRKVAGPRSAASDSDEAEKAARLAEGRKKFFEQSMGFDNGKSGAVTLTNENGGPPALGLRF